jgi:8-oxo-dGTP pyrophosphatase MutT (NUDIX family)
MTHETTTDPQVGYAPPLFALSAAVYARRHGKILVLKRAGGEATGGWYLPGGAVDAGETVEQAAVRELREESGLVPTGPLAIIGVSHLHIYGRDSLQVAYACDCLEGEVVLSHEHSGARWVDPAEYRERYFNDELITRVEEANAHLAGLMRSVRENLDRYIEWSARERPGL